MTISLVSALALRENMVRLTFDADIYYSAVLDSGDASDTARYLFTPDAASRGSDGLPPRFILAARADLFDARTIDLWVDRRFSPYPSRYIIDVNGLLEAVTLDPLVTHTASFLGCTRGVPQLTLEAGISNRDLANPQDNGTEASLGTFPVDDTGDIANDGGLIGYKKRVLRRLSTRKGRYKHLPNYGTLAYDSIKMLARPGVIQQIADDAESQIRQEPETTQVSVKVVMQGSLAFYRCKIRCTFGGPIELLTGVSFING
jgi:hypothetical protein